MIFPPVASFSQSLTLLLYDLVIVNEIQILKQLFYEKSLVLFGWLAMLLFCKTKKNTKTTYNFFINTG